jgi:Calx-beta domain/Peptidase M10 serralysin C terminal/RTX calcium-binding nonapeptide repeat (4 copies)
LLSPPRSAQKISRTKAFQMAPGNTFNTAQQIGILTSFDTVESINGTNNLDFYAFTLSNPKNITLVLSGTSQSSLVSELFLDKNSNGIIEDGEKLYGSGAVPAGGIGNIYTALGAGTYYAAVWRSSNSVATNYRLQLTASNTPSSFTTEPGKTLATAYNIGTLTGIKQYQDFVGITDDFDLYKFALSETNDIKFQLSGVRASSLGFAIYSDKNNNGFIEGDEILYSSSTSSTEELNFSLGSGTYYAGVYQNSVNVNSTYSILLAANPAVSSLPTDPGNTLTTAHDIGRLTGIKQYQDFVGTADNFDLYKFALSETNDVKFQLSGVSDSSLSFAIYFDRNNNGLIDTKEILYSNSTSSTGELNFSLGSGTYYAGVYQNSANVNSTYSVLLAANPTPPSIPIDPGSSLFSAYNIGTLTGIKEFNEFVGTTDEIDFYRFSLNSTSSVKVSLTGIKEYNLSFSVYEDSNNNGVTDTGELRYEGETAIGNATNINLGAGNYYVKVYQSNFYSATKPKNNINSTYQLTLVNNTVPSPPNTVFMTGTTSVSEDGIANLVYTFTRTGSATGALTVNYQATGSATFGSDYTTGGISNFNGVTGSVTFAAGSNQAILVLDPKSDGAIESNETISLALAAGSGYTIGTNNLITSTITNDDVANRNGVSLSIRNATALEGKDGMALIAVELSTASTQPVSLTYTTIPVNAIAGIDYTPRTGTLTIPANSLSAMIEIPILNDNVNEADESFIVTLSNPVNATLNTEWSSAEITITDTLRSFVSRTLPNGVENLVLVGTSPINGVGNAGNNIITGNAGNNYINGKEGNDTLSGGLGGDVYIIDADVDLGTDRIVEAVGGGTDTIDLRSTSRAVSVNLGLGVAQTIAAGVQVVLSVGAIENAYGGSGNDAITGNSLGNYLLGNAGNDVLRGDGGADSFSFLGGPLGSSTVVQSLGRDTISDLAVGTDKIVLSKAVFAAITGSGVLSTANFAKVANDNLVGTQTAAIVYSQGTGNLFYNQNGAIAGYGANGGNFAVLANKPISLSATDFLVVA